MSLLHAGVDTSVIALWLGHAGVRSTDAYLHADINIKEKALALTTPAQADRADTARPTRCSHSWRACNYAETQPARQPAHQARTVGLSA